MVVGTRGRRRSSVYTCPSHSWPPRMPHSTVNTLMGRTTGDRSVDEAGPDLPERDRQGTDRRPALPFCAAPMAPVGRQAVGPRQITRQRLVLPGCHRCDSRPLSPAACKLWHP